MLARTRAHKNPSIHLTEADHEILSVLLAAAPADLPGAALLGEELDRAVIIRNKENSGKYVRLNSRVEYQDLASGQVRELQVGLPKDASIDDNRISVLTPVGAALIGMRVGNIFEWIDAAGRTRTLKVLSVRDDLPAP